MIRRYKHGHTTLDAAHPFVFNRIAIELSSHMTPNKRFELTSSGALRSLALRQAIQSATTARDAGGLCQCFLRRDVP